MYDEIMISISTLCFVSVAASLAIIVWTRTRSLAWLLIVVGVFTLFLSYTFILLQRFGFLYSLPDVFGFPLLDVLVINLPIIFFILAFIVFLLQHRKK
ncbi:hypothetical protein WKV44_01965 [Spirochaetia bacterium 38H-sp]|uniref:Lycopene cyclase domain-containing protein n=1 Tax=Rarispira pelagica TaxID=3141764 RepID=A0ABU9U9G1_9SPIR